MAMYEDNARKISGILAAINPDWIADIIALGQIDAMLNIAERLDQGAYRRRAWPIGLWEKSPRRL